MNLDAPRLAVTRAFETPRRAFRPLHDHGELCRAEQRVALLDAEPAAMLAGPTGVRPQPHPVDAIGVRRLLHFDRHLHRVPMHDGAERSAAVALLPGAPTADRGFHVLEPAAARKLAEQDVETVGTVMAGRHASGDGGSERSQDRVDDRRQHRSRSAERRGRPRTQEAAGRAVHLDRPECAVIGGILRREEVLAGDTRRRHRPALIAGVERPLHLLAQLAEINRDLLVGDMHGHDDRDRRVLAHAVIVEERARLVGPVRNAADRAPHGILRVIPEPAHRGAHPVHTVLV